VREENDANDANSSTHIRPQQALAIATPPARAAAEPAPSPQPPPIVRPALDIQTALESFAAAVSAALEARGAVAAGHSQRVADCAVALARALRRSPLAGEQTLLSDHQLRELRLAALLHDFGMLTVPDAALLDSAPLDACKAHVEQGNEILLRVAWPAALRGTPELVRLHHERVDGSGYPRGLGADELPTAARLLAIADLFDAVSAGERPGKPGLGPERAVEVLRREARGGRLDPELVELLARERPWVARPEGEPPS
jgi:putative two-component system response regulator